PRWPGAYNKEFGVRRVNSLFLYFKKSEFTRLTPNLLYQGMVYWPHVQRRPMKEALARKTAGTAVHPSSPDVRKPSHAFNRWFIPVGAVAVHICIGSVYAWSTFNRPIQALFPNEPGWFSPPYTTFTTALVLLGLSAAFGGPGVERRGPRVAATAAASFFGAGVVSDGTGLSLKEPIT